MKIAIKGTGYVGLTTGVCLAEIGHEVLCQDISAEKIAILEDGRCPIYEPGLEEMIERNVAAGRLSFTLDGEKAAKWAEAIFIAVDTPPRDDWQVDLSSTMAAASEIAAHAESGTLVVVKSTVPAGTCDRIQQKLNTEAPDKQLIVVNNPEFLREGSSIQDTLWPDRIAIGGRDEASMKKLGEIYQPIVDGWPGGQKESPGPVQIVYCDPKSSELIKYASNAFLSTKISFINEIANLCEAVGANVRHVARGIGLDNRIGPKFLGAGIGYGGSCFPKDTKGLSHLAASEGYNFHLLNSVIEVNNAQRFRFLKKIEAHFGGSAAGKRVAVLGIAFKPNTDDIRQAPAIDIVRHLLDQGAIVRATDPVALDNARRVLPEDCLYEDPYEALEGAEAVALVTEWPQFVNLDWSKARSLVSQPVIFDGRNALDAEQLNALGFSWHGVGMPVKPA